MTAQYDYDVQERQPGIDQYTRIVADLEDSGSEIKAFLQDEWQLHPKLALNVGGRYVFQDYRAAGIQSYEIGPPGCTCGAPNRETGVARRVGDLSPTHPYDEYSCGR